MSDLMMDPVTRDWLEDDREGVYPVSDELMAVAAAFCLERWRERAEERGLPVPRDLSYACKFTSLFLRELIGGEIKGNWDHQFVELDGEIYDLNRSAEDVANLVDPWHHDPEFMGNPEHVEALESCIPRVRTWVEKFMSQYSPEPGADFIGSEPCSISM
ncbi:hypothetical protein [Sulfitobacter sp. R18_1]|uniref:hypothetical protein n=1 Tax=Sulfitobacter sp. R18_1 TaxID=2821104 RepID=UPI001ADBE1A0|nr:hypothetical protein [Sulfitobacter sp. R18_1]MBO9428721.1 hypothetical protein [Sulfitobacter sp. R18_1]